MNISLYPEKLFNMIASFTENQSFELEVDELFPVYPSHLS